MNHSTSDPLGLSATLHAVQGDVKLALAALMVISLFLTIRGVTLTARGRSQAWR